MDEAFAELLRLRLTLPLPGREAQFRMAASFRHSVTYKNVKTNAGVMLLLYPHLHKLYTVLMQRPEYNGIHSGQISFPGGKQEVFDKEIVFTALRETEEEFGILSEDIEVLGQLTPLFIPVSETNVFPFIGYLKTRPAFKINPEEVVRLIEFPVYDLFTPAIREEKQYTSGEYSGTIPYFNINEHHVWGATAMIMNEFLEVLAEIGFQPVIS